MKSQEKKNVYRSLGLGKITAPNKPQDNPSGGRIQGKGDLRAGKK